MDLNELKNLIHEVVSEEKNAKKRNKYQTIAESVVLLGERQKNKMAKFPKEFLGFLKELRAAAEAGNVSLLHTLLDSEQGTSIAWTKYAKYGQQYDGDSSDDIVTISEATKPPGELEPTQSEIDFTKSVGWPMAKWQTIESSLESPYIPGDRVSVSGNLILDGHHRWSGLQCMNPQGSLGVRDFQFPAGVSSQGQKLCALQLAVAAQRSQGQALPSASAGAGTNILGAGKSTIMALFQQYAFQPSSDPNLGGAIMMGDPWMEDLKKGSTGAHQLMGITKEMLEGAKTVEECGGQLDACPVRKQVAEKMSENLSAMNKNEDAPARTDMPQLDHADIGGSAGFAAVTSDLQQGNINIAPPWDTMGESASKKSEGVNLYRWNKLAGTLED